LSFPSINRNTALTRKEKNERERTASVETTVIAQRTNDRTLTA
jgi:hypothetical protein